MKQESLRLRPTGLWLIFGPVLLCMWLAAVNYSNNLVYAVLYLIGALSFLPALALGPIAEALNR